MRTIPSSSPRIRSEAGCFYWSIPNKWGIIGGPHDKLLGTVDQEFFVNADGTCTNFISRLQATTNDYVFSGKYDFVGASACVYKMCEWDVFHNSTNALMRFADGLGNVQPVVWEFGCTSNELEMVNKKAISLACFAR